MKKLIVLFLFCSQLLVQGQESIDTVLRVAVPSDTTLVLAFPDIHWFMLHRYKVDILYNAHKRVPVLEFKVEVLEEYQKDLENDLLIYTELDSMSQQQIASMTTTLQEADQEIRTVKRKSKIVVIASAIVSTVVIILALVFG